MVHYKWHWNWKWGTGELLNNGTHEIDMCRWALGVEYPLHVTSSGGRFHYDDDWEAFDTQIAAYQFPDGKSIHWEGRSCNGMPFFNRGRGALINGTEGSILLDRNGYWVYDLGGKEIRSEKEAGESVSMGTIGGGNLDDLHIGNFIRGINSGEQLNSPIHDANPSVTICHLGNISQRIGSSFHTDPITGKPIDNYQAQQLWGREYQPGWEPKV